MQVEKDKVVSIHYTLSLDSGEVIDDSRSDNVPLNFLVGHQQIIPGLEKSLLGLNVGDTKKVQIPPQEAYGPYDETLVQSVPRAQIPNDIELREGLMLSGQSESGEVVQVKVVSFDDNEVSLDFNHPLAGQNLNFDVEIMAIRDATQEELSHGHVH